MSGSSDHEKWLDVRFSGVEESIKEVKRVADKDREDHMGFVSKADFKEFKIGFEKEKDSRATFVLTTTKLLTIIEMKIKFGILIGSAFFSFVIPKLVEFISSHM